MNAKKSQAFRTIQYLLGHVNSNFIQDYFKGDQSSVETNQNSHLSVNNNQEVSNLAADNLLFDNLADTQQDE